MNDISWNLMRGRKSLNYFQLLQHAQRRVGKLFFPRRSLILWFLL